ncbi:MAG: peptidylprolyl isomerase [Oscillatoriales cyanobacterium RM1_1_9]|nr:peptidylprolyl isomerase [Oscillatoriales cyanobacterium SM2_3_0]NJO47485.1 peptidylprolyl isomerase [Oscillatoriales cyanobacterium RM2_1_1]NJO70968.1 peptidylprolyl isomerase [Oscillatoriales cyanobacterium RM1_1_9]
MKSINCWRWLVSLGLTVTLVLGGCGSSGSNLATDQTPGADPQVDAAAAPSQVVSNQNEFMNNLPTLNGKATVVMQVNGAPITIEVNGTSAPVTAGNFVDLVNRGVYDGLVFHRVIREPEPFVVQGGDPQGKDPNFPVARLGTGGFTDPKTNQERYIPLEIKPEQANAPVYSSTLDQAGVKQKPELKHTRGAIAMARSQMPDSGSAQFYFTLADQPFLDGDYAVFGYVTDGMAVVDKIQQGDRIESAKVTAGLENLKTP